MLFAIKGLAGPPNPRQANAQRDKQVCPRDCWAIIVGTNRGQRVGQWVWATRPPGVPGAP